MFESMKIGEEKELMENSDHVFIRMEMKTKNTQSVFKKPKWVVKKSLTDKKEDIEALADEIDKKLEEEYSNITQKVMEDVER